MSGFINFSGGCTPHLFNGGVNKISLVVTAQKVKLYFLCSVCYFNSICLIRSFGFIQRTALLTEMPLISDITSQYKTSYFECSVLHALSTHVNSYNQALKITFSTEKTITFSYRVENTKIRFWSIIIVFCFQICLVHKTNKLLVPLLHRVPFLIIQSSYKHFSVFLFKKTFYM